MRASGVEISRNVVGDNGERDDDTFHMAAGAQSWLDVVALDPSVGDVGETFAAGDDRLGVAVRVLR